MKLALGNINMLCNIQFKWYGILLLLFRYIPPQDKVMAIPQKKVLKGIHIYVKNIH